MNDRELIGIVIDAGHGGVDGGAIGNGIVEKDLNLLISTYMYDRFRELGVPVKMTRTKDETLDPDERVNRVLNAYGNGKNVIVISNHINAGGGDGAEVIYALRNTSDLSGKILNEISKEGQNTRKNYQQRLPSNPSKDYYFMLRETPNTEAVIVEYGFLDSPKDDVNQLKNNYENFAEAVVRAVAEYKNIPYNAPEGSGYYTVQKGDSLWKIANKFGITVNDLKELNNLTGNNISVGQTLKVQKESEVIPSDYLIYTVQKGDSLWSIANKYNTTVDTLKNINNLTNSNLTINQQLLVPSDESIDVNIGASDNITYIVKSGDSLWKIANSYDTTVDEIKKTNNLKSNFLNVGQELIIPVKKIVVEENQPNVSDQIKYVVVKGDNLYSIANKYNVTVDEIKKANNLTNNILQIGQVLEIPGTKDYASYTVVKGDSLWSIANKYGTTVNNLMKANNLSGSNLSIGQELIIPTN